MLLSSFFRKYFRRTPDMPAAIDPGAGPSLETVSPRDSSTRTDDPWFWSHFEDAANVVLSMVPAETLSHGRTILDFGCGDGITALGVASRAAGNVVGLDLNDAFTHLPSLSEKNLGTATLPGNLGFARNAPSQPFPVPDESVDLIYSWSVFEHLSDVSFVLSEFHRIAKPGATVFVQIEPLYFSAFGSHLQRLVRQPWAHLLHSAPDFERMASLAEDTVSASEQDMLYRVNAFAAVKSYLIGEFRSLNQITADDLADSVTSAGFHIEVQKRFKLDLVPPPELLSSHSLDDLLTNQVVLVARKR